FADDVVVGNNDARRVDDEAGAERDAARARALVVGTAAERARHHPALALIRPPMLVEEAAQELVERWAAKFLRHRRRGPIRTRLLGDRDIDDGRQHLFHERRKALLRDREVLRGGGSVRGWVLRPNQRRYGKAGAEPEAEGGRAGLLEPGLAEEFRRKLRHEGVSCCADAMAAPGRPLAYTNGTASFQPAFRWINSP